MAEEMNRDRTQQDEMTEEGGNRRRIAVVTGASSGLGRQFVRMLDRAGEVDEIWVVARRRYRLEELQDVVDTPLKMLAYDLTDRQAVRDIQGMLSDEDPDVRWLINCAGMGKIGSIETISMEDNETMIDLNCRAAVTMTQACVPYMEEGARIMNICSAAGFQPLPYLNVYAATKAFMPLLPLLLTKSFRWRRRPETVSTSTVSRCPPRKNTWPTERSGTHREGRRFPRQAFSQPWSECWRNCSRPAPQCPSGTWSGSCNPPDSRAGFTAESTTGSTAESTEDRNFQTGCCRQHPVSYTFELWYNKVIRPRGRAGAAGRLPLGEEAAGLWEVRISVFCKFRTLIPSGFSLRKRRPDFRGCGLSEKSVFAPCHFRHELNNRRYFSMRA